MSNIRTIVNNFDVVNFVYLQATDIIDIAMKLHIFFFKSILKNLTRINVSIIINKWFLFLFFFNKIFITKWIMIRIMKYLDRHRMNVPIEK